MMGQLVRFDAERLHAICTGTSDAGCTAGGTAAGRSHIVLAAFGRTNYDWLSIGNRQLESSDKLEGPMSRIASGMVTDQPPASRRLAADEVGAFDYLGRATPWLDWNRRGRILRRSLDQFVRVNHIDEHVALDIAAPHNLHFLENQRTPFAVNNVALIELFLNLNGSILPTGERHVRHLFGHPEGPG
jgi:hypothetical protein